MNKKYNGHAWCEVITTNIKNSLGLNLRKAHCLSHLHYVHDDCETLCILAFAMKNSSVVIAFIFH
jgi:hypothetical protein